MQSDMILGDHFDRFIRQLVASGRYADEGEVIREALRGLEDRERPNEQDEAELDGFLEESFADIEAGRVYPLVQTPDDLLAEVLRRRRSKKIRRALPSARGRPGI